MVEHDERFFVDHLTKEKPYPKKTFMEAERYARKLVKNYGCRAVIHYQGKQVAVCSIGCGGKIWTDLTSYGAILI